MPPLLWALGDPGLLARPSMAVVGARIASAGGQRIARGLAQQLGETIDEAAFKTLIQAAAAMNVEKGAGKSSRA